MKPPTQSGIPLRMKGRATSPRALEAGTSANRLVGESAVVPSFRHATDPAVRRPARELSSEPALEFSPQSRPASVLGELADRATALSVVFGVIVCLAAEGQPSTVNNSGTSATGGAGGGSGGSWGGGGSSGGGAGPGGVVSRRTAGGGSGGYSSGGERGGTVQLISNPAVQAELNLTSPQQEQIANVLNRVRGVEQEYFGSVRSRGQEQIDRMRTQAEERSKRYEEANQQVARSTEKILAALTPAQRAQLQRLCARARPSPSGMQGGMVSSQGDRGTGGGINVVHRGGSGGGTGGGSGVGGGGGGGLGGGGSPGNMVVRVSRSGGGGSYQSGGGPGSVVNVISDERVQGQLALTAAQHQQIGATLAEFRRSEADLYSKAEAEQASRQDSFEQGAKEREAKQEVTRQAVARAGEEIVALLAPAQRARLEQIRLQALGAEALFKPEVVQALNLTASQQVKLATLREEAEREVGETMFLWGPHRSANGSQPSGPERAQAFQQWIAERRQAMQRGQRLAPEILSRLDRRCAIQEEAENRMITTVLTPAQQAKLREMRGREFAGLASFPRSFGGGSGGSSSSSSQVTQ